MPGNRWAAFLSGRRVGKLVLAKATGDESKYMKVDKQQHHGLIRSWRVLGRGNDLDVVAGYRIITR